MDYLKIIYAIVPALIALIISEYKEAFLALIRAKTITDYEHNQMVIAVISARHHFEKRQAIRDTWWRNHSSRPDSGVLLRFVVGQSCDIHPDYRQDDYGCSPWHMAVPDYFEDIPIIVEHPIAEANESSNTLHYGLRLLSFRAHHPIVISKLGVHSGCLVDNSVAVKLADSLTEKEIVRAMFSKSSPGVLIQGFYYKPVEPYILPKGYEGTVTIEQIKGPDTSAELPVTMKNIVTQSNIVNRGVIEIDQADIISDSNYADPKMFRKSRVTLPSFLFTIDDPNALRSHLADAADKQSVWKMHVKNENSKLQQEADMYDDMLFVDVEDVYRNIPDKLLAAMQHLISGHFDFFLKTDDDCYIDISRILTATLELNSFEKMWFGRFRNNWRVEHYGKWAERGYHSLVYPRFACGSGYVLSRDLVRWLVDNSADLRRYQGEDVSLGVWLSAVGPSFQDDPAWQCSDQCLSDMYSRPEQPPHQLRQIWANKLACGDPCGC